MEQSEINKSRLDALNKIKEILTAGNVEEQFSNVDGNYYSKDKFIVSWFGKYKGVVVVEYSIDKVDSFYANYSGHKAIYVRRSLFMEQQLGGYSSIERALIEIGMKLCRTRKDKEAFFNQFATPYNERLKN